MIDLLAHLPHIFPSFSVPNFTRQVPRQYVYPALLVIMLTWKVRKGLFPAFHIDNIAGKMIGFASPAVQIILLAVKFCLKLSLPTVDISDFALVIQVKLAVLLVHIKSFIMFLKMKDMLKKYIKFICAILNECVTLIESRILKKS
jgi:hypothetical protein